MNLDAVNYLVPNVVEQTSRGERAYDLYSLRCEPTSWRTRRIPIGRQFLSSATCCSTRATCR